MNATEIFELWINNDYCTYLDMKRYKQLHTPKEFIMNYIINNRMPRGFYEDLYNHHVSKYEVKPMGVLRRL